MTSRRQIAQPAEAPGEPAGGAQLPAFDAVQAADAMDALRDEVARRVKLGIVDVAKKEGNDMMNAVEKVDRTSWLYALSADAEAAMVLFPIARDVIATGQGLGDGLELGYAFLRVNDPGVEGWSVTHGYWTRWYYMPATQLSPTGQAGASFEFRVPVAGSAPVTIARGAALCQSCANPYVEQLLQSNVKPKVRFTVNPSKPLELGLEVEFGQGKNETAERAVVHMRAPLTLMPVSANLALPSHVSQPSALGQPLAEAVAREVLTKADTVMVDAARWADAAFNRWPPRNEGVILGLNGILHSAKQPLLLRNRDAGDLNGDGVEDYTLDFLQWVPFASADSAGSPVPRKLDDGDVLGLTFYSLPEIRAPMGCTSCSRASTRGFYALRRFQMECAHTHARSVNANPLYQSLEACVENPLYEARSWGQYNYGAAFVGRDTNQGMPSRVSVNVTIGKQTQGATFGERLGASSSCIFEDEDCGSYEMAMRVDSGQLIIKAKSSPP